MCPGTNQRVSCTHALFVVSFDPGTSLFRLGRIDQRFERNHLNVLIYIETFSNANTTAWRLLQCSHHYCFLQSIMHMLWIAPVRGISWRIRGDWMSSLSMGRGEFNRLFQNQWIRGGGIRDNCWLIHGWAWPWDITGLFFAGEIWPGDFVSQNDPTPE